MDADREQQADQVDDERGQTRDGEAAGEQRSAGVDEFVEQEHHGAGDGEGDQQHDRRRDENQDESPRNHDAVPLRVVRNWVVCPFSHAGRRDDKDYQDRDT